MVNTFWSAAAPPCDRVRHWRGVAARGHAQCEHQRAQMGLRDSEPQAVLVDEPCEAACSAEALAAVFTCAELQSLLDLHMPPPDVEVMRMRSRCGTSPSCTHCRRRAGCHRRASDRLSAASPGQMSCTARRPREVGQLAGDVRRGHVLCTNSRTATGARVGALARRPSGPRPVPGGSAMWCVECGV